MEKILQAVSLTAARSLLLVGVFHPAQHKMNPRTGAKTLSCSLPVRRRERHAVKDIFNIHLNI